MYECLMPHCRAQVFGSGACCEDCWADRRSQLDALPELYVMVSALLTPGSRQQDIYTINLPSPDPAAPINLVALDSLTDGCGRLAAWADYVRRRAGQDRLLGPVTMGRTFRVAVGLLLAHDHRLALSVYAGGYVLDVWTIYRRLAVQCVDTAPRHLGAVCPDCASATLITRHADEYALCLTCGNTWPHSQLPMLHRTAQRTTS